MCKDAPFLPLSDFQLLWKIGDMKAQKITCEGMRETQLKVLQAVFKAFGVESTPVL